MGNESKRVPQLIAFDLDYTLWPFWIDTHVTPPLKRTDNSVEDKYGSPVEFYPDVPQILNQIRAFKDSKIAACSRTHTPALAREALSLISVPLPVKKGKEAELTAAINFFDETEIYPGSKIAHFKKIHERTGIPYSEMLFYDDEHRNREVESLGVTFILVRNGLNTETFQLGLTTWRRRRAADEQ
ncbi:magnesium-dependent phosphatase-1 [Hysterangium stoloniferum]|nr:magnesium-dependent phosphatase-1 [Hysterangium stoloniferum]